MEGAPFKDIDGVSRGYNIGREVSRKQMNQQWSKEGYTVGGGLGWMIGMERPGFKSLI